MHGKMTIQTFKNNKDYYKGLFGRKSVDESKQNSIENVLKNLKLDTSKLVENERQALEEIIDKYLPNDYILQYRFIVTIMPIRYLYLNSIGKNNLP